MTCEVGRYINRERVIELLSQLVEIHSPYLRENEIMDFTYNWFKRRDLPAEYHAYQEKKVLNYKGKNVVGSLKGKGKGPKILLNGHMDTVEICGGWTKDPLKATLRR